MQMLIVHIIFKHSMLYMFLAYFKYMFKMLGILRYPTQVQNYRSVNIEQILTCGYLKYKFNHFLKILLRIQCNKDLFYDYDCLVSLNTSFSVSGKAFLLRAVLNICLSDVLLVWYQWNSNCHCWYHINSFHNLT